MKITEKIHSIGVNDPEVDLFEGQYPVPEGMAYNSYVILDEKVAVLDTVDRRKADEWLANLDHALGGRSVDYLIIHHMEPDHSGSLALFLEKYPSTTVVATAMAFNIMKAYIGRDCAANRIVATDRSTLSLGEHTLTFFTASMVHWPEVMVSYDACDGVLFSADAFGKFGVVNPEGDDDWACEARRYYFGIVGKFGAQVQALLGKLSGLELKTICPLHGPVLTENLGYYLNLYNIWSSYGVESEGVVIAYASVYGGTEAAATLLAEKLKAKGCPKVVLTDLTRCDIAEAVEDAFRYGKLVLASVTYCAGLFPAMRTFIEHLTERGYQKRSIGFIENGSWAPAAAKAMKGLLEGSKEIELLDPTVVIRGVVNPAAEAGLEALADALMAH